MIPRSPYGCAKVMAYNMVRNYREAYDMFAVTGILFNHESPYRGVEFVTRKITHWISEFLAWAASQQIEPDRLIALGEREIYIPGRVHHDQGKQFAKLQLGNLDAYRDWGHAEDYVRAAWMMLQQDEPKDYVISMEQTHSIRDFLSLAFKFVGIDDWSQYITINPEFVRPCEVDVLIGNSTKAHTELGWFPKHCFKDLVYSMIYRDCLRKGVVDKVIKPDELTILPHNRIGEQ